MRLWLVVQRAEGDRRDVAVDLDPACRTSTLIEALARHVGFDGGPAAAYSRGLGTWLDGEREVAASGLKSGDLIVLASTGAAQASRAPRGDEAPFELRVVGGPVAGTTVGLAPGEHLIGRGSGATVRLDDPSISRAHVRLTVQPGEVVVTDAGSSNGTLLEGVALTSPTPLEPGRLIRAGRTLLTVQPRPERRDPIRAEADGSVAFNRPPRVAPRFTAGKLDVPAAPEESQRPRLPLAASLVPLGGGLALWAMTRNPISLVFAALTPVMAVWTFLEDRRRGRKSFRRKTGKYEERLQALERELEQRRADEIVFRREAAPDPAELLARARRALPRLWERRPADEDFLSLRVGIADQPSLVTVALPERGEDELREQAEKLVKRFETVPFVPVSVAAAEAGPVGVAGSPEHVASVCRWLVLQAATLHSPRDLAIAAAVSPQRVGEWECLKWLPHVRVGSPTGETTLASGSVATRGLLSGLARLLEERKGEAQARFAARAGPPLPAMAVLLDEAVAQERSTLGPLLAEGAEHGIHVLWLGSDPRALPGECRTLIEVEDDVARLSVTDTRSGARIEDVTADFVDVAIAREAALALAPVVDTSAAAGGREIPRQTSLLDLLGAEQATPGLVAERWRAGPRRPAGPIGVSAEGTFEVDLVRDGPHALVGGTTGAGKSELLQTLVASLAASSRPDRLTFLLVDYKGGAAFKECVELPHTVGFITDLDSHLTRRARLSLNAELKRREGVLRAAGAKDLAELAARNPERAPASLVIVIDEFATLANEVPEFVDAVVDVAQRGRTLGLHLVLATQRPRGAITENIRANTNFRVAMRVASAAESEDVIGAPDAARIPRSLPGRAFALTGHGELTEFQAAYVGGLTQPRREGPPVSVSDLAFSGPTAGGGASSGANGGESSDLRELVRAIGEAAESVGTARQPSPWLPPLADVIPLDTLPAPVEAGTAALGLVDEPAAQSQRPLVFDPGREGSLLVYGTTGSGKTTLLRTLAVALARRLPPEELHVYALDFATRGLEPLRSLPHCAGVVAGEDEELVARTFALLRRTLTERKDAVAGGANAATARLLVLLDGYSAFVAAYDRINGGELVEALPRLVADGRALGIHFAISADRRGAVRSALAGSVETRVVLRMADDDEYAALGIDARTVRGASVPPGRGFLGADLELQCALVGDDPSRETIAVAEAGNELAERHPGRAPSLARLPTDVDRADLPAPSGPLEAVLGLSDDAIAPVTVRLAEGSFLVAGPRRSGRTTALATIATSLRAGSPRLPLHLVVPRRSSLPDLAVWTSLAAGRDEAETFLVGLAETVSARQAGSEPIVLVVDDGTELTEGRAATALETIVKRGRDVDVFVVAAVEANTAHRTFGGWLRELRNEEHGLLLVPQVDVDGDLLGVRLARAATRSFPPGRGYLVRRGEVELVQVAR
jgi:DNA segregation ATPase FtsK/SpoIIIE, S-DNA-T family